MTSMCPPPEEEEGNGSTNPKRPLRQPSPKQYTPPKKPKPKK